MPVFVATLLCELVRREANGKISLLGLFGDSILTSRIPDTLPTLSVIQRWRPAADDRQGTRHMFAFEVRGPFQPSIRVDPFEVVIPGPPLPLIQAGFQLTQFQVPQAGEYQVVTFIDGVERNRSAFYIGIMTDELRELVNR
jgi:hypothetical protein